MTCWTGCTRHSTGCSEAYDGQRRFAGDASHQLRTPLAALLGQVQVALRRDRTPEEYRRILELVLDGGRAPAADRRVAAPAGPAGPATPEPEVLDLRRWLPDHSAAGSPTRGPATCSTEVADGVP